LFDREVAQAKRRMMNYFNIYEGCKDKGAARFHKQVNRAAPFAEK